LGGLPDTFIPCSNSHVDFVGTNHLSGLRITGMTTNYCRPERTVLFILRKRLYVFAAAEWAWFDLCAHDCTPLRI
jgi:hypothetical protein